MKKQNNEKPPVNLGSILIRVAVGLFFLTMISVYLLSGLFARYVTAGRGSDSARVATFGDLTLTENGNVNSNGENFIYTPGADFDKDIVVNFDGSEADTFVFVALDVSGWESDDGEDFVLMQGDTLIMNWSVIEDWNYLTTVPIPLEGGENTESNAMRYVYYVHLDSNTSLNMQVIQGSGEEASSPGRIFVSPAAVRADYEALQNVRLNLDVTAYAVQANGFYNSDDMDVNAAEAWASLQAKEVPA